MAYMQAKGCEDRLICPQLPVYPEQARLVMESRELLSSTAGGVMQLDVVSIDISATFIRKTIRQGRPLGALMPGRVIEYIHENGLYAHT